MSTYQSGQPAPNRPPLEPTTSYHPVDYGQAERLYEQAIGTRGIGRTDEDLGITPGTQAAANTIEMPASVSSVTPVAAGPARSRGDVIAATMRRTDPARLLEPDHPFAKAFAAMTPSMKSNYALALLHNSVGIGGVPRNENPFRDAYYVEKFAPEITGEAEMMRLLDKWNKGDTEGLDLGVKTLGWGNTDANGLERTNLSAQAQGDGGDSGGGGQDGGDGKNAEYPSEVRMKVDKSQWPGSAFGKAGANPATPLSAPVDSDPSNPSEIRMKVDPNARHPTENIIEKLKEIWLPNWGDLPAGVVTGAGIASLNPGIILRGLGAYALGRAIRGAIEGLPDGNKTPPQQIQTPRK